MILEQIQNKFRMGVSLTQGINKQFKVNLSLTRALQTVESKLPMGHASKLCMGVSLTRGVTNDIRPNFAQKWLGTNGVIVKCHDVDRAFRANFTA